MRVESAPAVETMGAPRVLTHRRWFAEIRRLPRRVPPLTAAALVAFLALVVKDAWLSDDAYITFRTVYNFTHGYGLVWNVGERVQSYTHPLWMFLLALFYAVGRDIYWSSLTLCFVCSVAAVAVVALGIARSPWRAVMCVALLCASKSFLDFSTSGLENPLTHLLLAVFAVQFLRGTGRGRTRRDLFWLALTAALATFNRMDTALLYLPALAYAGGEVVLAAAPPPERLARLPRLAFTVVRRRGGAGNPPALTVRDALRRDAADARRWLAAVLRQLPGTVGVVALGFSPFILWEVFSLWYYGFPFPNTAYAKLQTGVGHRALIQQGVYYLGDTYSFDPLLIAGLVVGFALPFIVRQQRAAIFVLGGLLYMAYAVSVGGDFMAGRFLTAPFFVAVIAIASVELPPLPRHAVRAGWLAAMVAVVAVGYFVDHSRWRQDQPAVMISPHGVADERDVYVSSTGIGYIGFGSTVPRYKWVQLGLQAARSGDHAEVSYSSGFYGYYAGPGVYLVDVYALDDPLLARLPALPYARIGHYVRALPTGYVDSVAQGHNLIQDPDLHAYYDKLSLITRGNLWDFNRLVTIVKMNFGQYNYLLQRYDQRHPAADALPPRAARAPGPTPMAADARAEDPSCQAHTLQHLGANGV